MRIFHITSEHFEELAELPDQAPAEGFLWIGSGRREFEVQRESLQRCVQVAVEAKRAAPVQGRFVRSFGAKGKGPGQFPGNCSLRVAEAPLLWSVCASTAWTTLL